MTDTTRDGRYRKRPVVIDAFEWTGNPGPLPDWLRSAIPDRAIIVGYGDDPKSNLRIMTLEGNIEATPGDWIIRGVRGELYPCKPDIFAETYERLQDIQRDGDAAERRELLSKAERLWSELQNNELGGFSGVNRPFWIMQYFKEIADCADCHAGQVQCCQGDRAEPDPAPGDDGQCPSTSHTK